MRQHPMPASLSIFTIPHRAPNGMHGWFFDQQGTFRPMRTSNQSVGEILFRYRFQGFLGGFHCSFSGFCYGVGHFFGLFDHMLYSLLDSFGGVGQVLPAGAGVMAAAVIPQGLQL